MMLLRVAFVLYVSVAARCAFADDVSIDFAQDVEPILQKYCIDCHGPDDQESQFRLDRLSIMLAGGNSGEPAVVPGEPEKSFLLKLIRHQEPGMEMPPDESLSPQEIDRIEHGSPMEPGHPRVMDQQKSGQSYRIGRSNPSHARTPAASMRTSGTNSLRTV